MKKIALLLALLFAGTANAQTINLVVPTPSGGDVGGTLAVPQVKAFGLAAGLANYGTLTGAAAGSAPSIAAAGSDTNINLTLTPKGTGSLNTSAATFNLNGTSLSAIGNSNLAFGGLGGGGDGAGNTAMGQVALQSYGVGAYNTGFGYNVGRAVSGGNYNVFLGANAGDHATSGSNNVVIGYNVGSTTITTGSSNILIGTSASVDAPAAGSNYQLNIGSSITGTLVGGTTPALAALEPWGATVFEPTVGTAIASAATIAPVAGITHVTGTAAIATITPPAGTSAPQGCTLTLIADGTWTTTTSGNIFAAMTAVAGIPYIATYDGTKWYIK